jgi:chorismate-pyruvate lyase
MTALEAPSAPQTRMLLASEGSTTTLLEALVGEPLRLRLHEVSEGRGSEVSRDARAALGLADETPVLVRRSALVTVAGMEVSRNHVVAHGPFDGVVGRVLTAEQPIGWTMNGSRAGHSRIVLDTGWSFWDADDVRVTCAYKSYVMVEQEQPRIHVFERFNPRFIPTTRHGGVLPQPPVDDVRGRT